jgi:predicted transposase/invertase (TIGR01784 family)
MYDSSLKYKWDNQNVLDYAVTTAEAKGIEKGKYKETIAIAREMKNDGMPSAQISKFTKLTVEQIEDL